jgi:hypothetical protein
MAVFRDFWMNREFAGLDQQMPSDPQGSPAKTNGSSYVTDYKCLSSISAEQMVGSKPLMARDLILKPRRLFIPCHQQSLWLPERKPSGDRGCLAKKGEDSGSKLEYCLEPVNLRRNHGSHQQIGPVHVSAASQLEALQPSWFWQSWFTGRMPLVRQTQHHPYVVHHEPLVEDGNTRCGFSHLHRSPPPPHRG